MVMRACHKKRLLVIEPDTILAEVLRRTFASNENDLVIATTASEAIMAANERTSAIILELRLAQHNGIELLQELRSYVELQQVAIIIYTVAALNNEMKQKLIVDYNIAAYLYKPTHTVQQLSQVLQSVLTAKAGLL
jgi:CheY-like chemotaxis protein